MAGELLSSKIIVNEELPRIASLPVVQTAVLGIVGKAVRGPLNTATQVTSFEDYARTFGEFASDHEMPLALRAFFLNGGRTAYVVRAGSGGAAAAKTVPGTGDAFGNVTCTVDAPWDLSVNNSLVVKTETGTYTATFTGTGAYTDSGTGTFNVTGTPGNLTIKVNGGPTQTISFVAGDFADTAAATVTELVNAINKRILGATATVASSKVRITSDLLGTDSSIQVTGGTIVSGPSAPLGFALTVQTGTGNVANRAAVTASEAETILNAALTTHGTATVVGTKLKLSTDVTGSGGYVQVDATSTVEDDMGWDTAAHYGLDGGAANSFVATANSVGTWGNNVELWIKAASNGDATYFNMEVEVDGYIVERFSNLQVSDSTAASYLNTVVNNTSTGSLYITTTVSSTARPNNTPTTPLALTGGTPPTVVEASITGAAGATLTGMHCFDTNEDITILILPETVSCTQNAASLATTYCEVTRNRQIFFIADPPASQTASDMVSHIAGITPASECMALYWPRVKIPNPSPGVYGSDVSTITVAPSGTIAGICARNDSSSPSGPFVNPAGVEDGRMFGVVDLETYEVLREDKRDLVFPVRINPIVLNKGYGFYPDGARTALGTSNFPSVGERRGVSAIESAAKRAVLFAKNKANTPALRNRVELALQSVIQPYFRAGALASNDPNQAYFVDVSDQLNNAQVRAQGKLLARIGLATAKPAEFIIITVSQDTRALEEELLSQA